MALWLHMRNLLYYVVSKCLHSGRSSISANSACKLKSYHSTLVVLATELDFLSWSRMCVAGLVSFPVVSPWALPSLLGNESFTSSSTDYFCNTAAISITSFELVVTVVGSYRQQVDPLYGCMSIPTALWNKTKVGHLRSPKLTSQVVHSSVYKRWRVATS